MTLSISDNRRIVYTRVVPKLHKKHAAQLRRVYMECTGRISNAKMFIAIQSLTSCFRPKTYTIGRIIIIKAKMCQQVIREPYRHERVQVRNIYVRFV